MPPRRSAPAPQCTRTGAGCCNLPRQQRTGGASLTHTRMPVAAWRGAPAKLCPSGRNVRQGQVQERQGRRCQGCCRRRLCLGRPRERRVAVVHAGRAARPASGDFAGAHARHLRPGLQLQRACASGARWRHSTPKPSCRQRLTRRPGTADGGLQQRKRLHGLRRGQRVHARQVQAGVQHRRHSHRCAFTPQQPPRPQRS